MGVDLAVAFDEYFNFEGSLRLAYSRLDLTRDRALWEILKEMEERPFDQPIQWYYEEGIKDENQNAYGGPLTYLTAGELKRIDIKDLSPWNKAVFRFIGALPDDTKVLLYWH